MVYAYGGRGVEPWWARVKPDLERCRNLEVVALAPATTQALDALAGRNMELQVTIQDGDAWLAAADARIAIEREWRMRAGDAR